MHNNKWKDASPTETVTRIRELLSSYGITCTEQMEEPSIPECYSSRIMARGLEDCIATNGKGTTLEYCLASGYAEFMERAQNRLFLNEILEDDRLQIIQEVPDHDSKYRLANEQELLDNPDSYLNYILQQISAGIGDTPPGIPKTLLALIRLREAYPPLEEGNILMQPFYNVGKKVLEWQPCDLIKVFFMSNGMAAGNTFAEALVQGFSEIFERYSQRRIMSEHITPPDIPSEVIMQYPYVAKTIARIESDGPYKVLLKDCSLGQEHLPVVCGIILNTRTLTFGIRFGSHPDMGIALERVFTESLQGKNLETFTSYCSTPLDSRLEDDYRNLFNTMKIGYGYYPSSFLVGEPAYEYQPWDWSANSDNQELVHQITDKLLQNGKEIWIHDASFMKFPTVWIVVPGMSELLPYNPSYLNDIALRTRSIRIFHDLPHANEADLRTLLTYCRTFRNAVLENTIQTLYRLPIGKKFHGDGQLVFLEGAVHWRLNEIPQAIACIQRSLQTSDPDEKSYLTGVLRYLDGRNKGKTNDELLRLLNILCGKELSEQILSDFGLPDQTLSRLYPSCSYPDCPNCPDLKCRYPQVKEFYRILFQGYASDKSTIF